MSEIFRPSFVHVQLDEYFRMLKFKGSSDRGKLGLIIVSGAPRNKERSSFGYRSELPSLLDEILKIKVSVGVKLAH